MTIIDPGGAAGIGAWVGELFGRLRLTRPMINRAIGNASGPITLGKGNLNNPYPRWQDNAVLRDLRPDQKSMFGGKYGAGKRPADPLGGLYEQLIEMLTSGGNVDPVNVNPIYDARVSAIENMMSRQEARTGRNREDVEGMYGALADDYREMAPEQAEQARAAQEDVEQLYGELASNVEGTYSRIANEQADLFSQLGIEAAAPDVLAPQGEQAAQAVTRANELGAINEQRYADIADIDQTYYREGAPLATLAGSNISSDLLMQLQDYLGAREQDILGVEAERSVAQQQAMSEAQAANMSQQSQQAQMLWQIMQSQLEAQSSAQSAEITPDSFMGMLPPQLQAQVGTAFRALERNPNIVMGRVEDPRHPVPGTFVPTTDEYWFNEVDKMFESGQIDDATRQYLLQYLRLYLAE